MGAIWDQAEIISSGASSTPSCTSPSTEPGCRFKLAPVAGRIRTPILIVHCEDDMLVPVDRARKLHDAIRRPNALHIVPKGRVGSAHGQSGSLPAA